MELSRERCGSTTGGTPDSSSLSQLLPVVLKGISTGGSRSIFDVVHESQQPLPFQRKLELGESRALDPVRQARIIIIAVKCDYGSAVCDYCLEHRAARFELAALNERE